MLAERLFDTNVLIYTFAAKEPRSTRAETLLADGGVIGVGFKRVHERHAAQTGLALETN